METDAFLGLHLDRHLFVITGYIDRDVPVLGIDVDRHVLPVARNIDVDVAFDACLDQLLGHIVGHHIGCARAGGDEQRERGNRSEHQVHTFPGHGFVPFTIRANTTTPLLVPYRHREGGTCAGSNRQVGDLSRRATESRNAREGADRGSLSASVERTG